MKIILFFHWFQTPSALAKMGIARLFVHRLACLVTALCVGLSPSAAQAATVVSSLVLDGPDWSLTNSNGRMAVNGTVTVPSSVPDELYKHGIVFEADPRFGYNQNAALDLMSSENFTFSTQVLDLLLLSVLLVAPFTR